MAEKELYDYVDEVVPDNDETMTLAARGNVTERTMLNQVIHKAVDGVSDEVITISSKVIAYISYPFSALSNSDGGTVFDFFHDSTKGNGIAKSFKLQNTDGHTYVVKFESNMDRVRMLGNYQSMNVDFKVIGKILD
jgi:hypothetical protein